MPVENGARPYFRAPRAGKSAIPALFAAVPKGEEASGTQIRNHFDSLRPPHPDARARRFSARGTAAAKTMRNHPVPEPLPADGPMNLRQRRKHQTDRGMLAAVLTMDACTLGACGVGWLLDQKFGTFPVCLAGLGALSVLAGLAAVLKIAVRDEAREAADGHSADSSDGGAHFPPAGAEEGSFGHD